MKHDIWSRSRLQGVLWGGAFILRSCASGVVIGVTLATLLLAPALATQRRTFDLHRAAVQDIQNAVAAGALTYERLVQLYLNRIERYDKTGPRLNAVIHVNDRALEIARALDDERRTTGLRSPLHGIPIAVKDNVDVRDLPSTGGNLAFANSYPARDATVIERLRDPARSSS